MNAARTDVVLFVVIVVVAVTAIAAPPAGLFDGRLLLMGACLAALATRAEEAH